MSRKPAKSAPLKENPATGLLEGKSGGNGHIGVLDDCEFHKLLRRIFKYNLTGKEIKYLICRFYWRMNINEIKEWDSTEVSYQAINQVFEKVYRKINIDYKKS